LVEEKHEKAKLNEVMPMTFNLV